MDETDQTSERGDLPIAEPVPEGEDGPRLVTDQVGLQNYMLQTAFVMDDFDGDGYVEVATSLENFYRVEDLQVPTTACPAWPLTLPRILDTGDPTANPNLPAGERMPGGACGANSDCAVC